MSEKKVFKLAILNDIMELELSTIDIDNIPDPVVKSKFRNLKKSTSIFSKFVDDTVKTPEIQDAFTQYYDQVNGIINNIIKGM
jgi:hypothetical protein